METKVLVWVVVVLLCVFMVGLTYVESGNPLYAAMMGGLVLLFGLLAVRAGGG